jgi:manganese-dependent inorganic pyrophosphatase
MKFRESGKTPSQAVAGVLLCGILSDTLGLRMSTTTPRDKSAVEYLAKVAGENPDELGIALLEEGMDLSGATPETILARDTKEFELSNRNVLISQVMVPAFSWNQGRNREIQEELVKMKRTSGADLVLVLFTSVRDNSSECYGEGDPDLLRGIFEQPLPVHLECVMSRKKDFLPWIGSKLRTCSGK